MTPNLQNALRNPSAVLLAGPQPANRNSVKKANGMLRFGAALLLGVALLSPVNALANNSNVIQNAWQQTTEMSESQQAPAPKSSYAAAMAAYEAKVEAEAIQARSSAPSFKDTSITQIGRNAYNFHKSVALGKHTLENASPEQVKTFMQKLVQDAYIELRAGHTVENPSQRLVDVCQQVDDIYVAGRLSEGRTIPHVEEALSACQTDAMQSNMRYDTARKVTIGGAALLLAGAIKGMALFALYASARGLGVFGGGVRSVGRREDEIEGSAPTRSVMNVEAFQGEQPVPPGPANSPKPR